MTVHQRTRHREDQVVAGLMVVEQVDHCATLRPIG